MADARFKIGIDVGGTFTHAVAVDLGTLGLAGTAMVPTTHTAREGVARGVVDAMHLLLTTSRIEPADVALIAHSTTQATNALLEGDVATVGIIGMGRGLEGRRARSQTAVTDITLAPGKRLRTVHRFLDTRVPPPDDAIRAVVRELADAGARVFVASEAFGVDDDTNERRVVDLIRREGLLATAASAISRLYGLRVRTRTAVINASMMPTMLETASLTERAVRESGVTAPLMIMRSDGGIMDIEEMRRRPIMTMLSGPAAGVAAALMHARVSDGLFLEVGGTSTDISIIRNGRPMVRSAEVGGHRLYVRTLDIRTVGIGGGSMPRVRGKQVVDVGPRSAHIAGLSYPSFASPEECEDLELSTIRPKEGDPDDYVHLGGNGRHFTLTATEAANILGLVGGYAKGNAAGIRRAFEPLVRRTGLPAETLSRRMLDLAAGKIEAVVSRFVEEYRLDRSLLALVGGGGGAEVIVPYVAERTRMAHTIADHAEVISAIGVALGMIQDTVERTVLNPTDADLLAIRSEAVRSVLRMGADPESVEVRVEVDSRQKRLSATAQGSPEFRARRLTRDAVDPSVLREAAARSCGVESAGLAAVAETGFLTVFQAVTSRPRFAGLWKTTTTQTRVVDREGVVRLKLSGASVRTTTVGALPNELGRLIDEHITYGDAGGLQPDVFVLVTGRIIDLGGLISADQVLAVVRAETEHFQRDERAVALVSRT